MRRAHTGTSVPHGLVGNGEFTQVHAHHFGFHFHTAKHFSVIDTNDTANHFGDNDHIPQVSLDTAGLFAGGGFLFGLAEAFDEGHGLTLEAAGHAASGPGADELHEFVIRQVQEGIQFNATEGELAELALFAEFGDFFGVHIVFM